VRIALCLSGQPRTWKRAFPSWVDNLYHLGDVDIFYHMWNYNTHPSFTSGLLKKQLVETIVNDDEFSEINKLLLPKKYEIQPKQEFSTATVTHPIARWTRPQFYGIKRAAALKREYEIDNKFEYDVVCRLRTDLVFDHLVHMDHDIRPNTMYTCMNQYDVEFGAFRVGDIFYYSDSYTYDQAANYYYALDYIDATWPVRKEIDYPPELAFYYYLKSIGIDNSSRNIHCKVARSVEYQELKGKLDGYETL